MVYNTNWRMLVQQQMMSHGLTPTEQRIALELLRARSNTEIGLALGLAERTIKSYLSGMMRKTHTHNRVGLVLTLLQVELDDAVSLAAVPTQVVDGADDGD